MARSGVSRFAAIAALLALGTLRLFILLGASTLAWAGVASYRAWDALRRRGFLAALALLDAFGLWKIASAVRDAAHDLPRWDFLCFYLYGRVAVLAHDVYDPATFYRLGRGLSADPEWVREILRVGFPYPPDSIIVPYFLGFFATPRAALVPWYAVLLAGFIACIALARNYVAGPWLPATLATFAFVAIWGPTIETLQFAQTIFLVAAFVFAYARERSDWRAGIWLALAVVVKPFVLVLVLVPLIRRQWQTLAAFAGTLLAALALADGLLGRRNVIAYFTDNPVGRYPAVAYLDDVNISPFSALLRARHVRPTHVVLAHETVFLLCALGFVLATVLSIAYARSRERDDYALALAICCALIVFPQTLNFYAFVLLVPFAILWKRATVHHLAVAAILAIDATLVSISSANLGAAVLILNWLGFMYLLLTDDALAT